MRIHVLVCLFVIASPLLGEGPDPRWGHVFVYDAERNEVLLFGGASERRAYRGDTWTWSDGTWTRHDVTGPSPRGFSAAAFDSASSSIVIHGGRGNEGVTHSDTWAWNGSEWRLVEEQSDWKADHHQIVWDHTREQLVGFGGWTGTEVLGSTWLFDDGWKRVKKSGPSPRATFGMAWNGDRGTIVLYGGLWQSGQYADIWEWTGRRWEALTGPYDESSLDHHSIVWDAERDEVVLFGGKNYRKELNGRTRVLSGKSWSERTREGPVARHSSPLVWHSGLGRVLVFGGKIYECEEQLPLGDMWSWDGAMWTRMQE